jgi:hypothetical protein
VASPALIYFPYYLISGTLKNVNEHGMCVLIFSSTLSDMFFILRRNEGCMIKNVHWLSCKVIRYSRQILMELEISRQIFEKYPDVKYTEYPFCGSRVVRCG